MSSSYLIGAVPIDPGRVATDLAQVEPFGFVDSYGEFVCGSWRTCVLWNAGGDTGFQNFTPGTTNYTLFSTSVTPPANATSANTFGNLYIVDRFTNLGETRVQSLDFNTTYDIALADMGTISLLNRASVLLHYQNRALPVTGTTPSPTQLLYEFAGYTTQGGGAQGTLPKLRMYSSADWSLAHWSFGIANTYIGPVRDIGAGGASFYVKYLAGDPTYKVGHVKAFSSWDLRAGWTSAAEPGDRGVSVTAGVNNLFNRMPPVSTNINPAAGANAAATAWRAENNTDVSTYGAIGRLIYVSAGVKF